MRRHLQRLAARAVRWVERRTGSGPYTRADDLERRLQATRSTLELRETQLEDVRARRNEVRERLDHARSQLRWMPPYELGWATDESLRRLVFADSGAPNLLLRLLYHRLAGVGIRPVPRRDPFADGLAATDLLHIHWVPDIEIASDLDDAHRRVDAWLGQIMAADERGTMLLRTVHELGGHDHRFGELHHHVDAAVLDRAAVVHALHHSTVDELVARHGVDRERIIVVEHPLYTGAYPDVVGRGDARESLGVGDGEILLLAFGSIRRYKGFERLVGVLDRVRDDTGLVVRLLIAGPARDDADLAPLVTAAAGRDDVRVTARRVPDDLVQYLMRAADLCVLPYLPGSLNSGVLLLAWTFDVPVVAPRNPVLEDLARRGPARLFDAASDDELAATLVAALRDGWYRDATVPAALRRDLDPVAIAGQFAAQLSARLTGR